MQRKRRGSRGTRWRGLTKREISHSTIARFHAKYQRSSASECWLWSAGKFSTGYGMFNVRRDGGRLYTHYAHRVAYVLACADIPAGPRYYVVMHSCDTRACVNPAHLSLGTQSDNIKDAVAKGRWHARPRRKAA